MSTKKIALVTGIAGQDGSYLASSDIGYQGAISFDASKPDGSPRKWMDSGRPTTSLPRVLYPSS